MDKTSSLKSTNSRKKIGPLKKRGYVIVTAGFFAISILIHWTFAWYAFVDDQVEHHQPIQMASYFNQVLRDTFENWQSEFLQLMWQIAGLSFLWYVGSPQSKESEERLEEKVDYMLERLDPQNAQKLMAELEQKYPKK